MQYDIVVVGGGMVGQAFALSMAQNNALKIAIIEPHNPNPPLENSAHARVSAIVLGSEDLLKKLKVWDLIKRKYTFTKTKVWDQNSSGNLDFFARDDNLPYLGHIIENDAIQSALFAALSRTQVNFISARLDDIQKIKSGYQLELSSGEALSADLLIAADGGNSKVRTLAKIDIRENDYQQQAIICNIESSKSFENTTWQRFLSDGIIALLPLSDTRASVVWSAENQLADDLMALSANGFAGRLAAGVEGRFGRFKLLNKVQAFPLIERSVKTYVKENLALIGDAAHNIHPLAGQGVNLGFADVRELSKQLLHNNRPFGDYSILRKYARARRLDNELMAKTMSGLNWIYKENFEPLRWLRGFGMNAINNNPALKSYLQKRASGKFWSA